MRPSAAMRIDEVAHPPCVAGRGRLTDRSDVFPPGRDGRRQTMRTPDEVSLMQRLHGLGWGTGRIIDWPDADLRSR